MAFEAGYLYKLRLTYLWSRSSPRWYKRTLRTWVWACNGWALGDICLLTFDLTGSICNLAIYRRAITWSRRVKNTLPRQWAIVRKDKWFVVLPNGFLCCLPPVFGWFFLGIARRDLRSCGCRPWTQQISQQFTRLDASPTLQVTQKYSSASEAAKTMIERDIYGYVVIPRHFDRDLFLGLNPQVSVFYNSQFILIGKPGENSALLQAQGTFNAQLEWIENSSPFDDTISSICTWGKRWRYKARLRHCLTRTPAMLSSWCLRLFRLYGKSWLW